MNIIDLNPLITEIQNMKIEISNLISLVQEKEIDNRQTIVDLDNLIKLRPQLGSKSTIYKKVHSGEIPHYKSFGKLRFNLAEIDALIYPKTGK